MPALICRLCGTHYPMADTPPAQCGLCRDPRFAINGQAPDWTDTQAMRRTHFATFRRLDAGLMGIGVAPRLGFDKRAVLIRTPRGNILWDCPNFIDDAAVTIVNALGGVAAIATSGPIGYGGMVEWSHAFDSAPIYVHATDRRFVARMDSTVTFWEGDASEILPGMTLVRCGGVFEGGAVLHWALARGGGGALMVGDTLRVMPDGRVGFMRSHVNAVPLDAESVLRIGDVLADLPFEAIYSGAWDRDLTSQARVALAESVRRHIDAIGETTTL